MARLEMRRVGGASLTSKLTNCFLCLFFKAPLAVAALPDAAQDKRQRLQVRPLSALSRPI